jgi:uncharacterized membrane protein
MDRDQDSTPPPVADGHYGPERMSALTDGVFAIVLTLLVLELRLPERDESVLVLMRDDWRVFVSWLISFVLLARFWLVHHAVTAGVRQCHTTTLALNFSVLGAVSLVPFSADVVGTERIAEPWSTVVFAANVALLSLAVGLLARHLAHESHLHDPDWPLNALGRYQLHHLYVLPAVALASSALAFAHPLLAVTALVAEFVYFASSGVRHRLHEHPLPSGATAPSKGAL